MVGQDPFSHEVPKEQEFGSEQDKKNFAFGVTVMATLLNHFHRRVVCSIRAVFRAVRTHRAAYTRIARQTLACRQYASIWSHRPAWFRDVLKPTLMASFMEGATWRDLGIIHVARVTAPLYNGCPDDLHEGELTLLTHFRLVPPPSYLRKPIRR